MAVEREARVRTPARDSHSQGGNRDHKGNAVSSPTRANRVTRATRASVTNAQRVRRARCIRSWSSCSNCTPSCSAPRFLPLKLGTYEDLIARHPDTFKTEELKVAMGLHARSTRYLESAAAGHARHDLDGNAVEPVAPEHVHHAILEVFKRRQARSKADLRPQLQERIIAAIEASGMPREMYAERVRARDAGANAALDEALAELGRQAAKREALLRAYEASGKDEAGFADMYGMDPAEVKCTLQRARSDKAAEAERAAAEAVAVAEAEAEALAAAVSAEEPIADAVPSHESNNSGHVS